MTLLYGVKRGPRTEPILTIHIPYTKMTGLISTFQKDNVLGRDVTNVIYDDI